MSNFIEVTVIERHEGTPGFVESERFNIHMDVDKITIFNNNSPLEDVTFVRLMCGATLCVAMPEKKFIDKISKIGVTVHREDDIFVDKKQKLQRKRRK